MEDSFFEKLKKGMGAIENPENLKELEEGEKDEKNEEIKKTEKEERPEKTQKEKPKTKKNPESKKIEIEVKPVEAEDNSEKEGSIKEKGGKWFGKEGQLTVDVYKTDGYLVVQSAVAGINPENLDISIENDLLTIRGIREKKTEVEKRDYFYQECYWGAFSRQIILPEEVDPSRVEAKMEEGILTITIPRIERQKKRKIVIKK